MNERSTDRRRTQSGNLFTVESLELRCLLSADHAALNTFTDVNGNQWCELGVAGETDETHHDEATTVAGGTSPGGSSPFDLASTFRLHTNPNAAHRIYLDFDGHTTSGTAWNSGFTGGTAFSTPAYNTDGVAGFSNAELTSIQQIWQRVAEDYIAFDVDITTESPASVEDLIKSGSTDSRWGVRVVIGGSSSDWYGAGAGGVAYIGSFSWNSDTPAYVFPTQLGNGNAKYVAEAVSHEAGHTLGLVHDGDATSGYYAGHGSGETGWAPIMGVGYYQNLTQWSRGEYRGANNPEDDLTIITTQNGFGYRTDDFGNSWLTPGLAHVVNSTTVDGAGVLERGTDIDVFQFATEAGTISFNVSAFEAGPNADLLAELYDSSGRLVTSANPNDLAGASISATVGSGTYFLQISGVGKGDPLSTGYSDYGSIGQYSFTGSIIGGITLPTLSINSASAREGSNSTFLVTLSAPSTSAVTVNFSTAGVTAVSGQDFIAQTGTLTFLPGETSKQIVIASIQDAAVESDETFNVTLSGASNALIAVAAGTGTILNDDVPTVPSVQINDSAVNEGKLTVKGTTTVIQTTSMTFTVRLSAVSTSIITLNWKTADGTALVSNNDYLTSYGTITFLPGQISGIISVIVLGDNTYEANETMNVVLGNPVNATISRSAGIGTIRNDDTRTGRGAIVGRGASTDNTSVSINTGRGSALAKSALFSAEVRDSAAQDEHRIDEAVSSTSTLQIGKRQAGNVRSASRVSTISAETSRSSDGDNVFIDVDTLLNALSEGLG